MWIIYYAVITQLFVRGFRHERRCPNRIRIYQSEKQRMHKCVCGRIAELLSVKTDCVWSLCCSFVAFDHEVEECHICDTHERNKDFIRIASETQ